ncbi:MAG: MATE family efflux transporter, partial [Eubacteriales bacterium]
MQGLTTGSPIKKLLLFMLPIFAGNILQQVYQMADNIIIGQFVGANAFAAVGATYGIFFLISGLVWGITAGFTVLTAQSYGESNVEKTRQTIGTAIWLSAMVTFLMTAVTVIGMPWLLKWMHTPQDIYREAYSYIVIICAGLAAQVLYNLMAGILRAVGNSKIPLCFLIFSSVLNVLLDLLFIVLFGMGAGGAALATVIAQGVSGLLCLMYIMVKVPCLHMTKEDFR